MTLSQWYEDVQTQFTADGLNPAFVQPDTKSTLPLVFVNVHVDSDMSSKTGTLSSVSQQIDIYDSIDTAPAEWEDFVRKVKWSLSKVTRWQSLTATNSIDTSMGDSTPLRRCMLIVNIEGDY
jgi:ribosome-associated translation inhibitor RaiA